MITSSEAAPGPQLRVVVVTGPSGAGRTTAVSALEDLGYEAINNLPISLMPGLFQAPLPPRPMALGIDVRNRDFGIDALLGSLDALAADPRLDVDLLYLDCRPDVLMRRYSETRRPHPMAVGLAPEDGIARELLLLSPVRLRAQILIDTSEFTPHDLRSELARRLDIEGDRTVSLLLQSFSYKRGLPAGIDTVFDCRFLRNPHWSPDLRRRDGRDPEVARYIADDARFAPFLERVLTLLDLTLPAHVEEGRAHLAVGFGCTGGQHRSVVLTERVAGLLAEGPWQVSTRHHELERRLRLTAPMNPGDAA